MRGRRKKRKRGRRREEEDELLQTEGGLATDSPFGLAPQLQSDFLDSEQQNSYKHDAFFDANARNGPRKLRPRRTV